MGAFRPPADAWSRRDFMRNGFGSLALVCTFASQGSLKGSTGHDTSAGAARAGEVAVRARSSATCRSRPSSRRRRPARASTSTTWTSRRAWPRSCPASRRRSTATRASTPGRRSARARAARRSCARTNRLSFDTNVHLHGGARAGGARRAPDGRDPAGAALRLHVPERPGRGVPLVPRPRARPHGADALLRPRRHVPAGRRARGGAGAAAGRVRRPARAGRPRVQPGRLVPLRGERRPRLPRRHDSGQRRGVAADGACSGGSTGCASSTRPTRAPTSSSSATGARCCRSRPTAACSSAPSSRSTVLIHPAERVELLVDFRGFRPGSEIVLQNIDGEATARRTSCASTSCAAAAARRRASRAGACARSRSCPRPTRAGAGTSRWPPPRACSGRSPSAGSTRRASTCGRGWGARSCGSGTTRPTACTRCTCTGCCSGSSSAVSGVIHPASAAWKDTIGVLPGETATVQPWFAPYTGRYVFHCHALEHGDKAMMLQLEVER